MPSKTGRSAFTLTQQQIELTFDVAAFDALLRDQGVKLVHYTSMPCPVGKVDKGDDQRPHEDHSGCSNGALYTQAGTITGAFVSNGSDWRQADGGYMDDSKVTVSMPRCYDDTESEIHVTPYDRFYLAEEKILVPHTQLVEAHATGVDKLAFPAVEVVSLVDASGRRYGAGDFEVFDGRIKWLNGGLGFVGGVQEPKDPDSRYSNSYLSGGGSNRGIVYSIRYYYRPYFYVERVLHQVRVVQVEGENGREARLGPQQVMMSREFVGQNSENDTQSPTDPSRKNMEARGAVFGPR